MGEESAVITHRIVTYFKRPKGQPGVTQLGSQRIDSISALGWILSRYPDEAWEVDNTEPDCLVIRLDRNAFDLSPSAVS